MKIQMMMFVNMSMAYKDEIEIFVWMSYFVEILLYLLTCVISPISAYIAGATHVFHRNLILIIQQGSYHFCLYGIARILMIVYESQTTLQCQIFQETTEACPLPLMIASFTRSYVVIAVNAGFFGCMIERIIATIFFATYEHRHFRPFFLFLIPFGMIFAISLTISYTLALFFYSRAFANYFEIANSVLTGLVLYLVVNENERRRQKLHSTGYTLSKRYQLTVNVKATKVIIIYIVHTALNNVFYALLFLIHYSSTSWTLRNILGMIINVQLAQYFMFSVLCLCCNREIYELSKKIFYQKIHDIRVYQQEHGKKSDDKKALVIDVHGKEMYTGANQNDYFAQLEGQWERMPKVG